MSELLQYRMVLKSAGLSHRINMYIDKKHHAIDYINTRYVKVHNSLFKSCTKGEGPYLPCDLEMIPSHRPLSGKQKQKRPLHIKITFNVKMLPRLKF